MPVPFLKSLVKKYDISLSSAEDCWEKAKTIALDKYEKDTEEYWKYVTGITKKCVKNKSNPGYKKW